MRLTRGLIALQLWIAFGGCNLILGNEDDYRLVSEDDGADASSGGGRHDAAAGASGRDGSAGDSGASGDSGGAEDSGGGVRDGATDARPVCGDGGPEDCFNNIDDDCNGTADCADPACAAPARCVPDPGGAAFGTLVAGTTCPAGYTARTLHRGLDADHACTGCSCVPEVSRCEASAYAHGQGVCGTSQYTGQLYPVYSTGCYAMPSDSDLYIFSVRSFTNCTPQGQGTPAPPRWSETRTFCTANRVGGGCPAGNRCVPAIATSACSVAVGSTTCGGSYPLSSGGTWYTGYSDQRSCGACTCGFGTGTCNGGRIVAYSGANCTGESVDVGSGTQGSICNLPFVPVSGTVVGTPVNPGCEPTNGPSGALTETGPQTVCCR